MAQIYQHQLHARKRRHWKRRAAIIGLLVLIGAALWLHSLKPQTQVGSAKTITKTIAAKTTTKRWEEPTFRIDLPLDWAQAGAQSSTHYHFQGGQTGIDDSRSLDIYVDSTPATLAVNRVLPIDPNGPGINVDGTVSANCFSFTGSGVHTAGESPGPAVWNNQPFICDLANYQRDVVGTISNQGINTIALTGPSGQHHFFFVYTDSSYLINYDIFISALSSFQTK